MRSFRQFVFFSEARKKDVISMYPHIEKFGLSDKLVSKYGMHLGKITDETHNPEKVRSAVENFEKYQKTMSSEKRDFSNYNSLEDVRNATKPFEEKETARSDINTVESVGKWDIKRVGSEQACVRNYGGGKTNWCVASAGKSNMFDHYSDGGKNNLYTIHNRENPEEYYAYHEGELSKIQKRDQGTGTMSVSEFMKDKPELKNSKVLSNSKWGFTFNSSKESIDKALDNNNELSVRLAGISDINADEDHIERALKDKDSSVRAAAAQHPNASSKQIFKALQDEESEMVGRKALNNPNLVSGHIDAALNSKFATVRESAAEHPKATSEQISRAIDDPRDYVRIAAIKNPNATQEHFTKALNSGDYDLANEARKKIKTT